MRHHPTPKYGFRTCIVAVRTPNEVVLGTDSGKHDDRGNITLDCKIQVVGKIAFANVGLTDEPLCGFDVPTIIKEAIKKAKNIKDTFAEIKPMLDEQAAACLRSLIAKEKKDFLLGFGKAPIEIVLCGIQKRVPVLVANEFEALINFGSIKFKINPLKDSNENPNEVTKYLGGYDYETSKIPDPINNTDLISYAHIAIAKEIEAEKPTANQEKILRHPIYVVQMTRQKQNPKMEYFEQS